MQGSQMFFGQDDSKPSVSKCRNLRGAVRVGSTYAGSPRVGLQRELCKEARKPIVMADALQEEQCLLGLNQELIATRVKGCEQEEVRLD